MRAALLTSPTTFTVTALPVPQPGPGEVRVRVAACGVCNSEVHAVRNLRTLHARSRYTIEKTPVGPQPGHHAWHVRSCLSGMPDAAAEFPLLMGHEVSGLIDALGAGVGGVAIGQHVTALTHHGFAEYTLARAANVLPLPDALPLDLALGEPIACASNAARRAGVTLGDTVALVGAGFMGALLLQFLLRLGAAQVIVLDPRASMRNLAARLGADIILDPSDGDPVAAVLQHTGGAGADVVVEATGAQAGLDLATALTRTRGRLIIYGYHQGDARTVEMQLWNLRGLDVVNAHHRDDDEYLAGMRAGLAMLTHNKLDMRALVTHRFRLEDVGEAFALAEQRPEGFVKAVVIME